MLLVKEKTYTIGEFLDYLNSKEAKHIEEVGIMLRNPRTNKLLVTITACLMHYVPAFADTAIATSKISAAGTQIFSICQEASYWLCLISCGIEIAKCIVTGDSKSISKVIPKYIIGFAGIYFLPWIFDLIKGIFS